MIATTGFIPYGTSLLTRLSQGGTTGSSLGRLYGYRSRTPAYVDDGSQVAQAWLKKHLRSVTARFYYLIPITPASLCQLCQTREGEVVDPERVNELADSMSTCGFRVDMPIFVGVDHDGSVRILNGRHRVLAALKADLKAVLVDLCFFGGSERNVCGLPEPLVLAGPW